MCIFYIHVYVQNVHTQIHNVKGHGSKAADGHRPFNSEHHNTVTTFNVLYDFYSLDNKRPKQKMEK